MLTLFALTALSLASSQISKDATADSRAMATLQQMTLDEKIDFISGYHDFNVHPIPRLGFPELKMSDGPVGIRNFGPTTAYPAGVCLAASFDPELARAFGVAIGRDARSRGVHIWLGPGVNLSRVPENGRNFEYLGEDPYLSSRMVVPIVQGVQSQGVVATVKHYVANNHENDRMVDSSNMDERVLRELYLKPFEAAVKEGGAWAVMCAYNKIDGTYCSENHHILTDVLKNDWGFKGILMSDWGAVHSTLPALKAGLDLEMPHGDFINQSTVKPLLDSGQFTQEELNDKVYRILRMAYAMGFADRTQEDPSIAKDDPSNESTSLQIAREGAVLLKNRDHLLPLNPRRVHKIVVVGPNVTPPVTGGGGSSYTTPAEAVGIMDALQKVGGPDVHVQYIPLFEDVMARAVEFRGYTLPDGSGKRGLLAEHFNNMTLDGAPDHTDRARGVNVSYPDQNASGVPTHFSMRWTGFVSFPSSGSYLAVSRSDDGIRVFLDDKPIIDDWNDHGEKGDSASVQVEKGRRYKVRVEYYQNEGAAVAQFGFSPPIGEFEKELPVHELQDADAVIASVGFRESSEGEGTDRTFTLPAPQEETLARLVAANPRTIVLNNSGAGVDMSPWAAGAGAILQEWYPGGVGNTAIAEILFGITNPSGKLAATFPKTLKGTYYSAAYPPKDHQMDYKEGLFMGYRWFDKNNVEPLFPFGYGLSYTTFRVSDLKVLPDDRSQVMKLKVRVTNTGGRDGAEVVQVYVHKKDSKIVRAERELKGFARVALRAGESKEVIIPIRLYDLAYWEGKNPSQPWAFEPGRYDLMVGTSSRDLPLKAFVDLHGLSAGMPGSKESPGFALKP